MRQRIEQTRRDEMQKDDRYEPGELERRVEAAHQSLANQPAAIREQLAAFFSPPVFTQN